MLELAVLGLLHRHPMHGYELRKQLCGLLCGQRSFSFGSLYPALRRLHRAGLIAEGNACGGTGHSRKRKVYHLTPLGREHFAGLLAEDGRQAWEDECFGVRLAFFARTPAPVRMRILRGRRQWLADRAEGLRAALAQSAGHADRYTRELHELSLDSTEREVLWLDGLIAREPGGDACPDHGRTAQQRADQAR
ncbi:PadR family transcriptional regulator [Allokutzneria albata]|uniref:DNA-binding transcriptional regulator, PadR family n=1 Tax=Allokutzneria albata TaxID=211114 RepID=A0A1G9ZSI9_ALLAB|nr:PadR family transcriptional regulator [Allokutzneria albata]SDN23613.1 DNA-binding transcriptional regulator, PadR family [Allokutzneria albata]